MSNKIFTFGSNEAGIHGAGAALVAYRKHGARYGKGYGHYGDSFAIPTKDRNIRTLPLSTIQDYVTSFLAYAHGRDELSFQVTRIGCGLAGYSDSDMAPMFLGAPSNCSFDTEWKSIFEDLNYYPEYWGTF